MSVLPIVKYGDPILRKVLDPVTNFQSISNILTDMFDTMYELEGIGLAANQIGLNLNLMIIDISHTDETYPPTAFANGTILDGSGKESMDEGCLSIPFLTLDLIRYNKIKVRYYDKIGKKIKKPLSGFLSRLFQHELDHLNGKLMLEHKNINNTSMLPEDDKYKKLAIKLINYLQN